jgi:tripartite-type tricarboxylate transporter receptor subunit TctC
MNFEWARSGILCLAAGLASMSSGSAVFAQPQPPAYPDRPIHLVVGFPAGGSADAQARVLAAKLSDVLGQPVLVDNKPGAGGNIGSDAVAKAPPDGYTLLLGAVSALSINPSLYPHLPFDPARDFAYVGQVAAFQGVVVVTPSEPIRTMKELVARAKLGAGRVTYGSPGNGTTPHLASKLFERSAGVEMQHVPYRGDAPALTDTVAGHVPVSFVNLGPALPLIRSGKVRALAVTGNARSSSLPEVPTLEEAGYPRSAVPAWSGVVAPARTPRPIVDRLSQALKTVAADAGFRDQLAQQTADVRYTSGPALAKLAAQDRARLGKVIREAGITLD